MPWITVDDKARLQLPPTQHWDLPPPRPVFPLYNVVMNALSTILPAMDPVNIAERKARIAELQLQSSPQARQLRQLQLDSAVSNLKYQNWLQGATRKFYAEHPELPPGAKVPASVFSNTPTVTSNTVDSIFNHPKLKDLPVVPESETSLSDNKPIQVAPGQPAAPAPDVPGSPPQLSPSGLTPAEQDQKFGPLPEGRPPPEGSNVPPNEEGSAAPTDKKTAWNTTGEDLGLPDRRWQSEEDQASTPEVMV